MLLMPTARRRRTLGIAASAAVVLAFGALLAAPPRVAAHAELESASPAAGASLLEPPTDVQLTFTEPIDPATAVVSLLDTRGESVAGVGAITVDSQGLVAAVDLPELGPGTYTVSYQVVSAVDGHATAGLLAFVVDPTGAETAPLEASSSTSPSVDAAAVVARWVALTGILVALGSLVMWWNAGIDVLRREAPGADRRPPWLLVGVSSALAAGGLAAYLTLAARPIVDAIGGGHGGHGGAGFPLDFAAPFGWTPFAIAMRVALAASAAVFAVAVARYFSLQDRAVPPGEDRRLGAIAAAALAVALAGMSMAGHAAATGGPPFGAIDWAHLASVAAWLGALPAALVLARRAGPGRRPALGAILRRHGRVALLAGPITAMTGLANTPIVLGASRDLVATDYGNLLLAKVVLLSAALGVGAVNHLALRRATRVKAPVLVGIDLAIALLAVLVGATMVTIQPAAGRQDVLVTTPVGPAHLYGEAGPSSVHAALSAAAPGHQTYRVTVTEARGGAPRDDVQKVFLAFTPPSGTLPPERIELSADETPGVYSAVGAHTPVEGEWTLEVTIRRAGAIDEAVSFELPVTAPEPPELVPPPDTGVDAPAVLGMLWDALPAGAAGWLPALLAAVGVALSAWWSRPGGPPWLPVVRLALLAVLAVTGLGAGSRALVTAANQPVTAASAENPVAADPDSVERGRRIYLANCAVCHGVDGAGDGPVTTLPDAGPLAAAVGTYADAELSYRIAVGVAGTPMPAFAGTLSALDRWDLVNYLRDLTASADSS